MKQTVTLMGAKENKGTIDGNSYDNTKLYIVTPLDPTNPKMMGGCTEEYNWGTSENFHKLKSLTLPAEVLIQTMEVSSGRRRKTIVIDVEIPKK